MAEHGIIDVLFGARGTSSFTVFVRRSLVICTLSTLDTQGTPSGSLHLTRSQIETVARYAAIRHGEGSVVGLTLRWLQFPHDALNASVT